MFLDSLHWLPGEKEKKFGALKADLAISTKSWCLSSKVAAPYENDRFAGHWRSLTSLRSMQFETYLLFLVEECRKIIGYYKCVLSLLCSEDLPFILSLFPLCLHVLCSDSHSLFSERTTELNANRLLLVLLPLISHLCS